MNIAVEDLSAVRKRLKIEVPANRVTETFEKVTDDFQKAARIPGFRPGHAPRAVVQRKFLKDIQDELQRTLVPQAYREAVESKKLRVVTAPEIEDLKYQQGLSLSFSTVVELAPEFSLPTYKGIKVKKVETTVTEEEVTQALDRIREQQADFVDVSGRALAMEDFAVIAYSGTLEGTPVADLVPQAKNLGESTQFWLWMKDDVFLPGFVPGTLGMNIGDKRDITVTFPADFPQAPLAGKTAQYSVTLSGIKTKLLPELNEEFSQKIAQLSLEKLKEQVRKELEQQKLHTAEREQKREIINQLLTGSTFELPPTLVQQETQGAVYDIVSENQARGIPSSMLEEKKKEIYENASKSAQEMVKLNFILQRIAEEEKIEVTQQELSHQIHQMAQQRQQPVEKIIETIRKNNSLSQIESRVMTQKALDFLLQHAVIE